MSIAQFDERTPLSHTVGIVAANTTTNQTIATGAVAGERIDDILLSNDDSIAHVVNINLTIAAAACRLASINVPAGSGVAGVPPVQVFPAQSPTNQGGYPLAAGQVLTAAVEVTMQTTSVLRVTTLGGIF